MHLTYKPSVVRFVHIYPTVPVLCSVVHYVGLFGVIVSSYD